MQIVGSSSASSSVVSLERQRERVEPALPVVSQSQTAQLIRRPVADIQRIEQIDTRYPYRQGFVFSEDDFRTQSALAAYASVERLRSRNASPGVSQVDLYA